jgi:hypothetical protein
MDYHVNVTYTLTVDADTTEEAVETVQALVDSDDFDIAKLAHEPAVSAADPSAACCEKFARTGLIHNFDCLRADANEEEE